MIKTTFKLLTIFCFIFILTSCENRVSLKAQEMNWGEDRCERCNMFIREKNHGAQVINPSTGKVYKFDDIGCVIQWFEEEKIQWKDSAKIWITDVKTSKWIDAKTAYYDTIHATPMAYGFSANEKKEDIEDVSETIDYKEMAKRIRSSGR